MAASYVIIAPSAIGYGPGGNYDGTYSYAKFPLGLEADGVDSSNGYYGRFVFAQGSNAGSQGAWVHLQNRSAVALASANATRAFPVGVACAALSATNVYGWVQVVGRADYVQGTDTGLTAGVPHYIGGTAGILISNAAAGQRVQGAAVPSNQATANSAGAYIFDLNRPFIVGVSAAL